MKRRKSGLLIIVLGVLAALALPVAMTGCATHQTTVTTQDAAGKPVTTTDVTKQSDSAVVTVLQTGVAAVRDTINLLLPPLVPTITHAITSTLVGPAPAPAVPPPTSSVQTPGSNVASVNGSP